MKHTVKFLKEIAGDKYHYLLDYLSICYQLPTEKLPVLMIYSNGVSGKTTFLKWIERLFYFNTIKTNGSFGERERKAVISQRDFLIESDANDELFEDLIFWNTTFQIETTEGFLYGCFSKFFVCSNQPFKRESERIFAIEAPLIIRNDLNLFSKLEEEVDDFRVFLENRTISTKKTCRLWFNPKELNG